MKLDVIVFAKKLADPAKSGYLRELSSIPGILKAFLNLTTVCVRFTSKRSADRKLFRIKCPGQDTV